MIDSTVHHGDCLEVLRTLADCSVDAVVTDPPYGLSFMGRKWDYDVPSVDVWAECLRVLKPGGHLLAFAGTRTQHRMCCRIEDAGFEIRDMIAWVYGSGFPKSHTLGGPRSGRSTALRTLVGALAEKVAARDLHVYGLDCGNGALLPLTVLAHTGAVVRRTEVERASRLIRRLTEEVARRQSVLGAHGFADIQELRSAAAPDDRLPYVLLVLDRWEGFMSDLADVDVGSLLDGMVTLLREGASVGIQVVVTGDRTLNSARVASLAFCCASPPPSQPISRPRPRAHTPVMMVRVIFPLLL